MLKLLPLPGKKALCTFLIFLPGEGAPQWPCCFIVNADVVRHGQLTSWVALPWGLGFLSTAFSLKENLMNQNRILQPASLGSQKAVSGKRYLSETWQGYILKGRKYHKWRHHDGGWGKVPIPETSTRLWKGREVRKQPPSCDHLQFLNWTAQSKEVNRKDWSFQFKATVRTWLT